MKKYLALLGGLMLALGVSGETLPLSFNDVLQSYQKKDFTAAVQGFQALAKLGDASAQFNLGVMYARGEGTQRDSVRALAWFGLAATSGAKPYQETYHRMLGSVTPKTAAKVRRLQSSLEEKYGARALLAAIQPEPAEADRSGEDQPKPVFVRKIEPRFPNGAAKKRISGQITVEFQVTPQGEVLTPQIIRAIPLHVFDRAALRAIRQWRFQPRTSSDLIRATRTLNFETDKSRQRGRRKLMETLIKKARKGDLRAQFDYALLLESLPEFRNSQAKTATQLYYHAAVSGLPGAQYRLATRLYRGDGCKKDLEKAKIWFELAATHNDAAAQYWISRYAEDNEADANRWLAAAANNGYLPAIRDLAWQLSTTSALEQRDGKKAMAMLEKVGEELDNDPDLLEIKAAALASQGQFKAARFTELEATNTAKSLHRDLTRFQTRTEMYTQNKMPIGQALTTLSPSKMPPTKSI